MDLLKLRERKNIDYDGVAVLTNEELDELIGAYEKLETDAKAICNAYGAQGVELHDVKKERDRLKAALEKIASKCPDMSDGEIRASIETVLR